MVVEVEDESIFGSFRLMKAHKVTFNNQNYYNFCKVFKSKTMLQKSQ